jgi:uncharacterized protein YndB with AHSA1/START domain/DNA-binding transcriptional ArsR family regulator
MQFDQLSVTFAALADPTRRAILARLCEGETSVTQLGQLFEITLPGISKHLKVLERAGLIARGRDAQWRPCRLVAGPLREVARWVEDYRRFWENSFEFQGDPDAIAQTSGNNMVVTNTDAEVSSNREFVISRVFAAPRELVFQAWTDPKQMARWWGPHHFTNPVCELDACPGGVWRIVMRGPDGADHPAKGVYREVDKPHRLVWTIDHSELSDQWHDLVNPTRDKSKGKPAYEVISTVTFEERDGKTTLTIRTQFESPAIRDMFLKIGMAEGWAQSLERLGTILHAG